MRNRFRMHDIWGSTPRILAAIIRIIAREMQVQVTADGDVWACQAQPRNARHGYISFSVGFELLDHEHDGTITLEIVQAALDMAEVDDNGLDKQDRRYLESLVSHGQTGLHALAAAVNLPVDTLTDEVEPFLLNEQLIIHAAQEQSPCNE